MGRSNNGFRGMHLWCSYLLILLPVVFISVHGQKPDSMGFISIDCRIDANSSNVDSDTKLTYVSDDQFIDTGVNYKIAPQYATSNLLTQFLTVRSFPNGTRNCYTLRSLTKGSMYLVRGTFMYGNYDKLNKPPIFDVHLGVNYWDTVNITTMDDASLAEIIATVTSDDYLQICLINKDHGTPFISALDLRPLGTGIYKYANSTQSLVYTVRLNLGESRQLRYPDDLYDRIWRPNMQEGWTNISTISTVDQEKNFATPSVVMQTAATTSSTIQSLDLSWTWPIQSTTFYVILHISKIQNIPSTDLREFDIFSEGWLLFNSTVPDKLYPDWYTYVDTNYNEYNVSLKATSNSTLPPLLNAVELYVITPATGIPTNSGDVTAINTIKANYKVNKGWSGDPCVPTEYSWTGVTCTSDSTNIPRITALNLSSSGLAGAIITAFGNLSALKSLDLSYNDLSGDLPAFLDELSALTYLDISGNNKLSTTLPPGLQSKNKDGNLIFKHINAPAPASPPSPPHIPVVPLVVAAVVGLLLIVGAIIIVLHLKRRKFTAMNTIKAAYKVNKGWSGDPCVPTEYLWTGLTCTSDSTNIPRITVLNLSSSGLTGAIVSSFGDLSALQSLDLSYNDLSGDLPAFLDKLSALTYLDVTGNNKISTTLPPGLRSKEKNGYLTIRSTPATATASSTPHIPVVPIAVAGVVVLFLIVAVFITIVLHLRRRSYNRVNTPKDDESHGSNPSANDSGGNYPNIADTNTSQGNNASQNYANLSNSKAAGELKLDLEIQAFSYDDLVRITNKFHNNIATGGFGSVYVGALQNGTQVAVKMHSNSSSQGVKEFQAEATNLARVHHRNLVSLIGYCKDGDCMALVYEYMHEGTLHDKLKDIARPLSWKQRVRIAYESALGLEYLHKACYPALIHRDVKTSNILLNKNLEAKLADFGLSRAFNNAATTHVSNVTVVGTLGYLDPEGSLEIITGQPPFIAGPEGGQHLKQWVNQKLSRGDIESIVDPRMNGQYDINSVWKVTELARKCTENSSAPRPVMTAVVTELKESLDLEISTEGNRGKSKTYNNPHNHSVNENFVSDVSQKSAFEMAYMGVMSGPGPEAR